MPQILKTPASRAKSGTLVGIILYMLLVLVPIGLKLDGITRVATWPWWKVTGLLWLPWGMLVVVSLGGWLLHLVGHRPGRG